MKHHPPVGIHLTWKPTLRLWPATPSLNLEEARSHAARARLAFLLLGTSMLVLGTTAFAARAPGWPYLLLAFLMVLGISSWKVLKHDSRHGHCSHLIRRRAALG